VNILISGSADIRICRIASVAIENQLPLLHNDKDFKPIETHCGLKIM